MLTGEAAARFYGVSRKTIYRWADEGRLYPWEWGIKQVGKRQRGPKRNPASKRYVCGRHAFTPKPSGKESSASAGGNG